MPRTSAHLKLQDGTKVHWGEADSLRSELKSEVTDVPSAAMTRPRGDHRRAAPEPNGCVTLPRSALSASFSKILNLETQIH